MKNKSLPILKLETDQNSVREFKLFSNNKSEVFFLFFFLLIIRITLKEFVNELNKQLNKVKVLR